MVVGEIHQSELEQVQYRKDLCVFYVSSQSRHVSCDTDCSCCDGLKSFTCGIKCSMDIICISSAALQGEEVDTLEALMGFAERDKIYIHLCAL